MIFYLDLIYCSVSLFITSANVHGKNDTNIEGMMAGGGFGFYSKIK